MSKSFVHTESYMHRFAVLTVARWLRHGQDANGNICLPPAAGRAYGRIWTEYPIMRDGSGANPVWDEITHDGAVPTADELIAAGRYPACVCDVAWNHKGSVWNVIEVVHKHPTPPAKKAFLESLGVQIIEVSAYWVLAQIGRPDALALWEPKRHERQSGRRARRAA